MATLKEVILLMKMNEIDIIGSYSDTNLKYFSDIDLEEFVKTKRTYSQILKLFQYKYTKALSNPNMWVTDFKSGFYNGKPIKWSYDELMDGYKYIDSIRIPFIDTLTQISIIKFDLVILLDDIYVEITTNYYFDFTNKNKTYREQNREQKLLYDYKLLKEDNFYKALKRLYSYYKLTGNKEYQKILLKIFNSKFGFLNKQISGLKTIELLLQNDKKPKKKDIINAIYSINDNLKQYKYDSSTLTNLDNQSLKKIENKVNDTIGELSSNLDGYIYNFINKSNISSILI